MGETNVRIEISTRTTIRTDVLYVFNADCDWETRVQIHEITRESVRYTLEGMDGRSWRKQELTKPLQAFIDTYGNKIAEHNSSELYTKAVDFSYEG